MVNKISEVILRRHFIDDWCMHVCVCVSVHFCLFAHFIRCVWLPTILAFHINDLFIYVIIIDDKTEHISNVK